MTRLACEPAVEVRTAGIDAGAGLLHHPPEHRGIGGLPGKQARHERIADEQPGERRKNRIAQPAQRQQRTIETDQHARRQASVQAQSGEDRGPRRMSYDDFGLELERPQQRVERGSHAGKRHAIRICGLGEPMPGKIRREHAKMPGEQRCEGAPGMCGRAGAMHQQQRRTGTEFLHVPAQAARLHEAARTAIWPIEPVEIPVCCVACRHRHPLLRPAYAVRPATSSISWVVAIGHSSR